MYKEGEEGVVVGDERSSPPRVRAAGEVIQAGEFGLSGKTTKNQK